MEEYPRLISLLLIFARNNQRAIVFLLFLSKRKTGLPAIKAAGYFIFC
ncbi:hypothetical protein ESA_02515 [Cronobacter sakazakii ATCC BAA-894]|uniref:Uncharacterized protein n=1 Tax=Cronobacter sakazakii (strain ATCC BAA-894) TaxID=290339 RepID=A7MF12_CROS8|nr:hypothetical protein ESA_02515 [Cronobacter sakazakii ATCC BAA-894]